MKTQQNTTGFETKLKQIRERTTQEIVNQTLKNAEGGI
jgi:hypothetical protein